MALAVNDFVTLNIYLYCVIEEMPDSVGRRKRLTAEEEPDDQWGI